MQKHNRKSEIRKDYIVDRYVLIAPVRNRRPHPSVKEKPVHTPKETCYFCPETIDYADEEKSRIGGKRNSKNWEIITLANKFPAVSLDNPKAYGAQEVVVDVREHEQTFEEFPLTHVFRLLKMYQQRVTALSELPNIQYILTFKNQGGRAGASVHHSHSQLFATSFLPPHIFDKASKMHEYALLHGSCAFCDILKKEEKSPRWVWSDELMACFAPYASMHNYETWIVPKRHADNITELTDAELRSLAYAMQSVVKQIVQLGLPYNFYFHQVIYDSSQHMYVKIIPRGSVWAGVEIGSGLIINPVPPEEAAQYFKKGWGG